MKHTRNLILGLAIASAFAAGTASADVLSGVSLSGDVHGATAYNFRGQQFSANEPSIGVGVKAEHASGVFAAYEGNTVKLSNTYTTGFSQMQHALSLGYAAKLGNDLRVGGGVTKNVFSGRDSVNDLSFGEVFGFAQWNGVTAKLSYNVDSAVGSAPGFAHGDLYGEVGYTHRIGKYSLGGDIGRYWYANNGNNPAIHDGIAVVNLRAGYAYNDHLSAGVTHQAGGHDPFGNDWLGDHTTRLDVKYAF